MARLSLKTTNRRQRRNQVIVAYWNQIMTIVVWFFTTIFMLMVNSKKDIPTIGSISSNFNRYLILYRHAYESDAICISELRMTRRCFTKLCDMLKTLGGLRGSRNMSVEEQVAIFLHIIAHNVKNRTIICNFRRFGEKISRLFSRVCNAVIRLHPYLLKKPEPITESSTDQRWKWFKVHKGASKWRNKAFPHFEDLCTVFGKDRAQGNKAKDFVEMVDDANIAEQTLEMDDDLEDPMEVSGTNVESEECSSARTRKRKNRLDYIIEGITNAATVLGKELREASTSMTQILKAEVNLQNKTSMVSAEISKFSSMSRMDKFKASRKIMRELEAVLTFWNLEGDERETFVELMLEE